MSKNRLGFSSYFLVGSMLFGLFFGAGNLIFPVEIGQEAGRNYDLAGIGFLLTAIGLPFLGIVAIGITKSSGLHELSSRINKFYGLFFTIALYLTIGPLFAIPRTATVSFEISLSRYMPAEYSFIGLFIFSLTFFLITLYFSLRTSRLLFWIGKVLNPIFFLFLSIFIFCVFFFPMSNVESIQASKKFTNFPFFQGFLTGYQTMDALASLVFGVIVVETIKGLGVTKPKYVARETIKAGFVSVSIMAIIYFSLVYLGATSVEKFGIMENGGVALAVVSEYYFGGFGAVVLAVIVIIACLITAIGLITACSETFSTIFPNSLSYSKYAILFCVISFLISNLGLESIKQLSIPVLMFLYPLAITLIFLSLLSPLFNDNKQIKQITTLFVFIPAFVDGLKASPEFLSSNVLVKNFTTFFDTILPFTNIGLSWLAPLIIGFVISLIFVKIKNKTTKLNT